MTDWPILLATVVGPVVAVLITLWYQDRSLTKTSRMNLFSTMMRLRRNPMDAEFVGALNLVPLHFHSKKAVLDRYQQLMATFEDNGWESGNDRILQRLNEKVNQSIALLLSEMSKVVGRPVEQLSILHGAYAPRGWVDDQQVNNEIRQGFRRLLTGQAFLPVVVLPPSPAAAEPQPPAEQAAPAPVEAAVPTAPVEPVLPTEQPEPEAAVPAKRH